MLKIKCSIENTHIRIMICLCICLLVTVPLGQSKAAVSDSPQTDDKALPASFELTDIWFYDQDMVRQIPALDSDWVVAVIEPVPGLHGSQSDPAADDGALLHVARTIVRTVVPVRMPELRIPFGFGYTILAYDCPIHSLNPYKWGCFEGAF